jgi:mannose/cellobiose epimerase-like protein (N-acyl-D-glucosamine 2-epimerase family)
MLAWVPVSTFDGWENAFVAMSVALGVSVDEARASLDDAALARVEPLVRRLRHPTREGRAKALATGLAHIMLAIEKTRLA